MSLQFDFSSKDTRNLNVLRRIVPHVIDIIESVPHVAVYKFEPKEMKWVRFNVEGAAFVIQNTSTPFYQLVVLNKEFPEDFILDLVTINKVKVQTPYLMVRYSTGQAPIILGFWFHDDAERDKMMGAIERSIEFGRRLGDVPTVNVSPERVPTQQQLQQQNLMNSMASPVPSKKDTTSTNRLLASLSGRSVTDSLASSLKSQLGIGGVTGSGSGSGTVASQSVKGAVVDTPTPAAVKSAHESTQVLKSLLLTPASARSQISGETSLFPTDQEISSRRQLQGQPLTAPPSSVPAIKPAKTNGEPKPTKKAAKATLSSVALLKEALAVSKSNDTATANANATTAMITTNISTSVASASSTVVSGSTAKPSAGATMTLRTILQRPAPDLPAPVVAGAGTGITAADAMSTNPAEPKLKTKTKSKAKKAVSDENASVETVSTNQVQASMMYVPAAVSVQVSQPPKPSSAESSSRQEIGASKASAESLQPVPAPAPAATSSMTLRSSDPTSSQSQSQKSQTLLSLLTGGNTSSVTAVASSSASAISSLSAPVPSTTAPVSSKSTISKASVDTATVTGKSVTPSSAPPLALAPATVTTVVSEPLPVSTGASDLLSPSDLMRLRSKLK